MPLPQQCPACDHWGATLLNKGRRDLPLIAQCNACGHQWTAKPDLSEHEPPPVKNDLPAVWDLVKRDIDTRDKTGELRYGTRLQPHNGRKAIIDLYQELLDAVVYTRQLIYEEFGE